MQAQNEMNSLAGSPQDQRRQFARIVLSRPPAVRPQAQFLYSNASYGIAGAMVEKVTGKSWESLMRTRLFEPLGIHATFDWPASDDAQQPWGHFQNKSGPQPHDPHDSYYLPACLAPGGGISMSIEDYAKFFRLHLQGLRGHDGLLRAKLFSICTKNQKVRTRIQLDSLSAEGWLHMKAVSQVGVRAVPEPSMLAP